MNPIPTAADYKALLQDGKAAGYSLSNCFFLPEKAACKIRERKLFYERIDNGFLLLEDEGIFYRCYYFLAPEPEPAEVNLDKPAVIEFPFQEPMTDKQKSQISKINRMGFSLERCSQIMTASSGTFSEMCADIRIDEVVPAEKSEACRIRQFLLDRFDPMFAFIPSIRELEENIVLKRVWVIRDGTHIVGVLNSDLDKSYASISHIAVDENYRGKGFAKKLIMMYHKTYADAVRGFRHWVDLSNGPAINMYQKLGYQFGIRRANEYAKRS